jgi:hypothetical protein
VAPIQLQAEQFSSYPPLGRGLAADHLPLLRQLPPAFVPFLLKEIISFDWKFPAERLEFTQQLAYLESLSPQAREKEMAPFAGLKLSAALDAFDSVNLPQQYLEQLSAHLWATHQMDTFRAASESYIHKFNGTLPAESLPARRLAVVLIGAGARPTQYRLFRKIRRQGILFSNLRPENGLQSILEFVSTRAKAHPVDFAHWYIDGSHSPSTAAVSGLTTVTYDGLAPVRQTLVSKMRHAFETAMAPETFRTMLAGLTPESLGLSSSAGDSVLNRFQVSLLTEGSGTQVFSTTFVQWTAREALRRAKPLTLVARFTPRQRERPMNELLAGALETNALDPDGALIDADMGAWYTWLNLQRLSGADQSGFLVWLEGQSQAVCVGPAFARGAEDKTAASIPDLLGRLS